jgi:uncharacterized protein
MNQWSEIQFMPILSTGCQASCNYCFGPNKGKTISQTQLEKTIEYISTISYATKQRKTEITFHGGEPLLAGMDIWEKALSQCREKISSSKVSFSLQSNLWKLTPAFCDLFKKYKVSIGTSLDGPKMINDRQRGKGYFELTSGNIDMAVSTGIKPGIITTFTPLSEGKYKEIFSFFLSRNLSFSIHPCVDEMGRKNGNLTLPPLSYGELLCDILDLYIPNRHYIQIPTLDQMILSFVEQEGQVCTFRDCLGMFIAICPDGYIYSCQRFTGKKEYALGNISNRPSLEDLFSSPMAKKMIQRQETVKTLCSRCDHYGYCKGGCLYNAWSSGSDTDPYCPAYQRIFGQINKYLLKDISGSENRTEMIFNPRKFQKNPLLRKGPFIELTRKNQHPTNKVKNALAIVTIVELARQDSIACVSRKLKNMGVLLTSSYLHDLKANITQTNHLLNNLYVHLGYKCQLECTHCYAVSDKTADVFFDHSSLERLIRSASALNFRQVVFTGGEPLLHPQIEEVCVLLSTMREKGKPLYFVLRSNFVNEMEAADLEKIARAFDKIIVSLDGDEEKHDARRGKGSYAAATKNIIQYQQLFGEDQRFGELSLACVLSHREMESEAAFSILGFAQRNHIRNVRFRPVLPIGRAMEMKADLVSEALSSFTGLEEILANGYSPVNSCGLGRNLYVGPDGDAFPCYAFRKEHTMLGNVLKDSLETIIESEKFRQLSSYTVDTNPKCRSCIYRYLCGGACRAWGGQNTQFDPNAPPPDCTGLFRRSEEIYQFAINYLKENKLVKAGQSEIQFSRNKIS